MVDQASARRPAPGGSLLRNLPLWVCASMHTVNDACFAVIYPLLPLLAVDLQLSYAEVGLVKTVYSTASNALQLPVGLLAERWGEFALLVGGNAWVAVGLVGMGLAGSYLPLLALSALAGLGGNAQHPLAASLVARHAPPERRASAIGILNFAGDLGKMAGPPLVALVAIPFGWRTALIGLGIFALVYSLFIWRIRVDDTPLEAAPPKPRPEAPHEQTGQGWGITRPKRFAALSALGIIDSATRGGALAFLPFILAGQGLDLIQVSWMLTIVFAGGAFGKFGCGMLGDRFGALVLILSTELLTCLAIGLFPSASLLLMPLLALAFGFALNGTSSVLYAMVADFVSEHRRARGYGLYYTFINCAQAIAPVLYGLLGDQTNLTTVFYTMAAVNLLTIPLAVVLKPRV